MSPILDVQYRYRELGRLRMGDLDGKRPMRLDTWRLTSPSLDLLRKAASAWGGEPEIWENAPTEGEQYELTTEVSELPVLVPPQDIDGSQWYELWSGGGIKRRCDGQTDFVSGRSCPCRAKDPDADLECKPTTQLLVVLPSLPDVGVWRLVTRGWNAAAEIPSTVKVLRQAAGPNTWAEAKLAIEQRTSKTEGQTHHFVVPALRLPFALQQLIDASAQITTGERGLVPITGRRPELPPDASFRDERDAEWGADPAIPDDSSDEGERSLSPESVGGEVSVGEHSEAAPPADDDPSLDEPATPEQWARLPKGIGAARALAQVRKFYEGPEPWPGSPPSSSSEITKRQLAAVIVGALS